MPIGAIRLGLAEVKMSELRLWDSSMTSKPTGAIRIGRRF